MKIKLLAFVLIGFALVGCKSEVDKCVDGYVLAKKHEFRSENELNNWKANVRRACMKAAAGQ